MQPAPQQNLAVPIAIVIAGILVAGAVVLTNKGSAPAQAPTGQPQQQAEKEVPKETYVVAKDDHILGNPSAPVKIIEYSDFECPFCKRFHPTLTRIMDEYGKTGQVALVYRHFPLDQIHPQARPLANASECAAELGGETAFWKAHGFILSKSDAFDLKNLSSIAGAAGVDAKALQACVDSSKYNARIDRDFTNGVNAGIAGTPFSFVVQQDGRVEKIGGAYPYENVKAIVDSLLAPKQ